MRLTSELNHSNAIPRLLGQYDKLLFSFQCLHKVTVVAEPVSLMVGYWPMYFLLTGSCF